MSAAVYQVVTDRVVALLERGTVPWQKPWTGAPQNLRTRKEYRGINTMLLGSAGYGSPFWLSAKQVAELGGTIRQGEHSMPCVFWLWGQGKDTSAEDTDSKRGGRPCTVRYYRVWNVEQCSGIEVPELARRDIRPIEECERIVAGYPAAPSLESKEPAAFYRPSTDTVNMPARSTFLGAEEYYSTLFHELTHSTGHRSRLNRAGIVDLCRFGSTNYSKEELIAEMGATFLCALAGIENRTIDNSAAYLASWLKRLKDDPALVVQAAQQAQKAADHILGRKPEYAAPVRDPKPAKVLLPPPASTTLTSCQYAVQGVQVCSARAVADGRCARHGAA